MRNDELKWNLFIAVLAATGVACKPALSPVFNLLTDAIFIPGGSATAGVSIAFLLVGASLSPTKWTASKMGFVQGMVALVWGVSAFQGLFVLVSYTIPALVVDVILRPNLRVALGERAAFGLAGVCGVMSGAFVTNMAFFSLNLVPMLLFLGVGALSGLLGSRLAMVLTHKLRPILMRNGEYDAT